MKTVSLPTVFSSGLAALSLIVSPCLEAQEAVRVRPGVEGDLSLRLEIQHAVDEGIEWLKKNQNAETGAWSDEKNPAITALAVAAILGDASLEPGDGLPPEAEKGLAFIASNAHRDGGIYGKGLATYNTSLSLMALIQSGEKEYLPLIAKGRRFLINQQQDFDVKGETDAPYDGGIGYGGSYAHSDLSNTHLALEALYYSKKALADTEYADEVNKYDLDWDAAIEFVSQCQNTDQTAEKLEFVAINDENRGGFVYFPGDSKAGEEEVSAEKVALRSYGSMSYAGLLSFIYAQMSPDDERVAAVRHWLGRNYTLDENPEMGAQGLFYYYHTMAKALALAGDRKLELADGETVDWRTELAVKLFDHQQRDGSWINEASSRWWEDDPVLVTAYSLLALQHVQRGL